MIEKVKTKTYQCSIVINVLFSLMQKSILDYFCIIELFLRDIHEKPFKQITFKIKLFIYKICKLLIVQYR